MPDKIRKFKLPFLGIKDNQLAALPWGRQLEHTQKITQWKETAKRTWASQKRQSNSKAIKEVVGSVKAVEWYCEFHDSPNYRDDTFEVYYKTQEMLDAQGGAGNPDNR